jgi:hypothetical protein
LVISVLDKNVVKENISGIFNEALEWYNNKTSMELRRILSNNQNFRRLLFHYLPIEPIKFNVIDTYNYLLEKKPPIPTRPKKFGRTNESKEEFQEDSQEFKKRMQENDKLLHRNPDKYYKVQQKRGEDIKFIMNLSEENLKKYYDERLSIPEMMKMTDEELDNYYTDLHKKVMKFGSQRRRRRRSRRSIKKLKNLRK